MNKILSKAIMEKYILKISIINIPTGKNLIKTGK